MTDPLEFKDGRGVVDFGVLAVRNGLLTAEQLENCRRKQEASANLGQNLTLQQIVLGEKLMTPEDIARVQRAHEQLTRDRERKQDLKFKGYEIISTLGEGGLGSVFKARQISMNRLVALKVLHIQWINDDEFRKRFVLEARIVGKLSHQNLIQVYDVGKEGDYYYFSMEFIDGRTVEDYIHEAPRKQMEVARAVEIIIQVVRAIRYYKDFDIVHRDIKPTNVMVTKTGVVKLGDFGFVKSKLDKELGFEGMVLGTPDYIAPEQAMGKDNVDYRADVYSLGATFYHMLTGRPMYDGTPSRVMVAHTREPMPDPRTFRPGLTDDVVAVLMKMLAKDPDARYANLDNLFADLEHLLERNRRGGPLAKIEIGKSSVLRALKIEQSRQGELAGKVGGLESKIKTLEGQRNIAYAAAAFAALLALILLIVKLAT
ncbi:MAG: serine/threonine protein kinase [Planctomycetes bacterium]|nr:serine/threonine protein kinase [Planctomycetota bacterium]